MLEEVLRYNNLGKEEEYKFVLFKALSSGGAQVESDLIKFCQSNLYSIGFSIAAILSVLKYMSLIFIEKGTIRLNTDLFSPRNETVDSYFQNHDFYSMLFSKLEEDGCLNGLFNEDSLRYSNSLAQYYVRARIVEFKLYPIRNLLRTLGFFQFIQDQPNHLYIQPSLTTFFEKSVIQNLKKISKSRRITLLQIRESNLRKDEWGKEAEEFVLGFEKKRLADHRNTENIKIISEDFANAGFDIQSYNEIDSIFTDRFIEVKSFSGGASFFWSLNEIETCKELRNNYYLYLINRDKISSREYSPIILQDPYMKVFENGDWERQAQNWLFKLA